MYKKIIGSPTTLILCGVLISPAQLAAMEAPVTETTPTTEIPETDPAPAPASIQDTGGVFLYGAMTFGGETLATTGDYDLDAGGKFHLAAGYEKPLNWGAFRITFGYKFDSLEADNGDASISRLPVEAVVYKRLAERHKLGGGLVYEISPEYEINIDGDGSNTFDFDNAVGVTGFYSYSIGSYEWGLRHTFIEYESRLVSGVINADNTGLYFVYKFFGTD
jgi:hypothetical protein